MANLIQNLTSISPELRSGPSPGRRLFALTLCSMLVLANVFPGVAPAGESDSEGEGTSPSIEVPEPPDFDPGGEEADLEEVPATGGEEGGAVELEPEVEIEAPSAEEVTSAATEPPVEVPPPPPVPEPASPAPEPEQQKASGPEPVANESIVAPKQERVEHGTASEGGASVEATAPEATQQKAPSSSSPSPQPVTSTPADPGQNLGKDTYVVRPGDCLWHIAVSLLPGSADTQAIADEVERLWRLNEDRIGTGDPNLIYAGTELRLR